MKKVLLYSAAFGLLLLALGVQYKLHALRPEAGETSALSFPLAIGSWQGHDLKLDHTILDVLKPDWMLFRRYRDAQGGLADVFCVFYRRQKPNQTLHSPANCYPGSGWDFLESRTIEIRGLKNRGNTMPVKKTTIRKGADRRTLYYWYHAGAHTSSSPYLYKLFMFYSALFSGRSDGGLVTVSTRADDPEGSEKVESDFLPLLMELLISGES